MATHKHIDRICIASAICALLLTLLLLSGARFGIFASADGDLFTASDQNADWDRSGATQIVLSDAGSTVKGNGAYIYQGNVNIAYAGRYVLSGSLSNGQIILDADGDDDIWLLLDGVSLHCDDDAAIRVEQAGKVFLTLEDGTENSLSSGAEYAADAVSAGIDGTIYSRDDLTINGSGALCVTAEYRHGIVCNDDLVIAGGSIAICAVQDGIHAHDSVRIRDAAIRISAGDDGITASNAEETAWLYIASGTIDIADCYEGLEAISVTVAGGTVTIAADDDGINANGSGENAAIHILGGDITIVNADGTDADGLDSNRDIFISGGRLFISVSEAGGSSAIDYGSENGGVCQISGGTVLACGSSAMAEGFDADSPQGFLMYAARGAAGTTVTLEDADGNSILSEEVPCSFSSVLISSPEMEVGDTCTIVVGETRETVTVDNRAGGAGFGGVGMPQDSFMRGGMPGGEDADAARGEFSGGSNDSARMDEREMPESQDGTREERPGRAADGAQPPDAPDQADDVQPPDMADGAGGAIPPGREQKNGSADGGLQMPDARENGAPGEPDSAPAEDTAALSAQDLCLIGISAGVLILGCVVAACFKQRG